MWVRREAGEVGWPLRNVAGCTFNEMHQARFRTPSAVSPQAPHSPEIWARTANFWHPEGTFARRAQHSRHPNQYSSHQSQCFTPVIPSWGWAADWEEYMVKRGMMLNLMPIPHVLQMNEIFPTSRTTDDSGRCMVTGGADVCDSQAKPGVTT